MRPGGTKYTVSMAIAQLFVDGVSISAMAKYPHTNTSHVTMETTKLAGAGSDQTLPVTARSH